jgi:PAS domain S-box-containing protein
MSHDRILAHEAFKDLTVADLFKVAWDKSVTGKAFVALDGTIVAVNPTFARWLDYPPGEMEGHSFLDYTKEGDKSADMEAVRRVIDGTIPGYTMSKTYYNRHGDPVHLTLTVEPVHLPNGNVVAGMFSQVENPHDNARPAIVPPPIDRVRIAFDLCKENWRKLTLMLIIISFTGEAIRNSLADGRDWAIQFLGSPLQIEEPGLDNPPEQP